MKSCVAISPVVRPSATRRSTSISRRLRPPGGASVAAVFGARRATSSCCRAYTAAPCRSSAVPAVVSSAARVPELGGDALAERGELRDVVEAGGLLCQRTEQHRRGGEEIEPFEQRGHAGERDDELRHVAGAFERGDGIGEEHQRGLGFTVRRVEASGVAREEPLEELHAVLAHELHTLVPRGERASHVGLGERHTGDPQRVRDPVRVPA